MNAKEFSTALGNIQTYYIHEAASYQARSASRKWLKIGAAAACFCLVISGGIFAFRFSGKVVQKAIFSADDITNLSAIYNGTILVDNLTLSNAMDSSVTLCYAGINDDYKTADWKSLSVSADYDDYTMVMNCSFEKTEEPADAYDVLMYGDMPVYLTQMEATSEYPHHIAAHFEYAGVYYDLAVHASDPDCIFSILETIIGSTSESAKETVPFIDILGYSGYRIRVEESIPGLFLWHYLAKIDGKEVCVAEMCGYLTPETEPDAYSIDLDNDGIPELICNETAGTGAQFVTVYRNSSGNIEAGRISQSYLTEEHGLSIGGTGTICEQYDPEKNIFLITGTSSDGDPKTVLLEGLTYFEFLPYISDEAMQGQNKQQ